MKTYERGHMDEDLIWKVRGYIYDHFAETALPPSTETVAGIFQRERAVVEEIYGELHRRHALFLEPGTHAIRMAWPFSGVATRFQVLSGGLKYWANCAWDSLGIPAALHKDAQIDAFDAWSNEPIQLAIRSNNAIYADERIHFLAPFARWYDDIAFT
jgi:hypothetical protein